MRLSVNFRLYLILALLAPIALSDTLEALARIVHDKVPITINAKDRTVTFPLLLGKTKAKHNIWYIITDASDPGVARALGVNYSPRLALIDGDILRAAYVSSYGFMHTDGTNITFEPSRTILFREPGKNRSRVGTEELRFFPPLKAAPGSIGGSEYTPYIQLNEGITFILNAPIIASIGSTDLDLVRANKIQNRSVLHDRVVSIDPLLGVVTLQAEEAFFENHRILYLPMESSDAGIAALEKATYAPRLKKVGINVPSERFHYITYESTQKAAFIVTKHQLNDNDLSCSQGWESQMESLAEIASNSNQTSVLEIGSRPITDASPCNPTLYSPLLDLHIIENNGAKSKVEKRKTPGVSSWNDLKARIESDELMGVRGTIFGSSGIVTNGPAFLIDPCD